ncbi:hypothetical protein TBK1r_64410 [Stieleria magnilauensis]|uniref:Uncharacterized protein n=2 Tax=Stieleria magnilauensis TaxID=2527963 RepID=A0ABX5Y1K3_9BACT|nr:hypothetical protein TBK1r_64410 [Planctomycetes bacterium TBK1r]
MPREMIECLDFSTLPSLEVGSTFAGLDSDVESVLHPLPATLDRASAALKFAASMSNTEQEIDGSSVKMREAFFRAALGEFVAMEEMIKYDKPSLQYSKILKCQSPLLHILKQIRNLHVHLLSKVAEHTEVSIRWADQASQMTIWFIEDISMSDFNQLDGAKWYWENDKERMLSWFNDSQRAWGVNYLIQLAVNQYVREAFA